MGKIRDIMKRKPLIFLLLSFVYLLIVGLVKWNSHPTIQTVTFVIGGLLGVYFLDIAEVFFALTPSPFRSIVFVAGLTIVSLFIITSSASPLASGLVLSLILSILLWQIGEWKIHNNLNDWYRMIAGSVTVTLQRWILWGSIVIFIIYTVLFIRQ